MSLRARAAEGGNSHESVRWNVNAVGPKQGRPACGQRDDDMMMSGLFSVLILRVPLSA
jgi:hypothetical protein